MGSKEKAQSTQHHPPHISSLVVRPYGSNDEESGSHAAAGDYDPEDSSRDRPSFARADRHKGHRTRASSGSPAHRLYEDHRHGADLNHSSAPLRGHEFSSRREASGRHRDYSPPYARGGAGDRPHGKGFDGPELAHGPFETEAMRRNNNPKVQPRDGDWYCLDPLCRYLNFARREYCNKCKKYRCVPANSPPPPHLLPPSMNLSPRRRGFNSYRSPRGRPRDYPPPRHDHSTWRDRDPLHYADLDYPPSRRRASDWVHNEPHPKPHYERRRHMSPPRPLLHPPRGSRWGRLSRERSRSPPLRHGPPLPLRGGPSPHRDYRGDSYFKRGRGEDPHCGRDRMGKS